MSEPSSLDRAPEPPLGYRLLRTLGHGGDGWVALALQESVGRQVAIKTLYAVDPTAAARLLREGQALSRLASERIVRVYDLIDESGRISLVMELVDGPSLADRLGQAPAMTAGERLTVLRDVAEALAAAHRAGVVHRDVKPSNVLLDQAGRAKLSDFGIARLTGSATAFRTMDGTTSGTRRYAAPEQWISPESESPAMDAYSFGVLAYEVLVAPVPDEGLPAVLPSWLAPPLGEAFRSATAREAAVRLDPTELVRQLMAAPLQTWPVVEPAAAADEGTTRVRGARPQHPGPLASQHQQLPVPAAVAWAEQPVFKPVHRRRRPPALLVGLIVGLLVAAIVGAISI